MQDKRQIKNKYSTFTDLFPNHHPHTLRSSQTEKSELQTVLALFPATAMAPNSTGSIFTFSCEAFLLSKFEPPPKCVSACRCIFRLVYPANPLFLRWSWIGQFFRPDLGASEPLLPFSYFVCGLFCVTHHLLGFKESG